MARKAHSDELPEAYPALAPELLGRVFLDQHWRDLAFLHWPVAPEAVERFFPRGTEPDVLGGSTWVSLVPFRMVGAGFGVGHPVPYLGSFLETNVRLYSTDAAGRRGVVFRSLDADRLLPVLGAQAALRMPYKWSRMRETVDGDLRTWQTARRWPRSRDRPRSRISLRVGAPIDPTPIDVFLTARWGAHTSVAGRTLWVPNQHETWPLHDASMVELDDDLCAAAGVPVQGPPALVRFSPGVQTVFGRPGWVRSGAVPAFGWRQRRLALRSRT